MHTEASAQRCTMSGIVVEKDGTPVEAAVVLLPESNLWGVTSGSGEFIIRNVGKGKVTAEVSCLGYATARYEIDLQSDTTGLEELHGEEKHVLGGTRGRIRHRMGDNGR